jgi:hypothetical protein
MEEETVAETVVTAAPDDADGDAVATGSEEAPAAEEAGTASEQVRMRLCS